MGLNKAKLISKKVLTEDVLELNFETEAPFNFTAGQYISIKIKDKENAACMRAYSISSAPRDNRFELCLKLMPGGRGSVYLNSLKKDDYIEFLGPMGKFTLDLEKAKNLFFIATGTGIAPLKSMIEDTLQNQQKSASKNLHLIFGVRYQNDIFYQDLFENLAKNHPNFQFTLTLSRGEKPDWKGDIGRVTVALEKTDFDTQNTDFYICGLSDMINDVDKLLAQKGVEKERIHFEKYD